MLYHEVKFRMNNIEKYISTEPLDSSGSVSNPIPRYTAVPSIPPDYPPRYTAAPSLTADDQYEDDTPTGYIRKEVDVDFVYSVDSYYLAIFREHARMQSFIQELLLRTQTECPRESLKYHIPAHSRSTAPTLVRSVMLSGFEQSW
jgi:hypothetical protein